MSAVKIFQILSITITVAFVLFLVCRGRRQHGLTYLQVITGLGIKIALGTIYGYLFLKFYHGDDTWYFFDESLPQTKLLLADPSRFFLELTPAASFEQATSFFGGVQNYFSDLEFWIQVKLLAIFNLVTFYDYYLDMCLLNGLFFFGHYFLYRLITNRYELNTRLAFALVFCFLPAVFWLSGIRPDGYLFLFVTLSLLATDRLIKNPSWYNYVVLVLGLLGTLIFRPPYAALLVAALVIWALIEKAQRRPGLAFFGVYGLCILVFFGSGLLSPLNGLPAKVVERQQTFFELKANTRYKLDSLRPDPLSFLKVSPQALNNTALRPYLWEAKGILQFSNAAETLLVMLFILFFIYKASFNKSWYSDGLLLAVIGFALSVYLFTGFTVPYPGAIVRYRAIPELLFIVVAAASLRRLYNN